ncbi:MAG TPA: protein kinase, partial [Acidobacteriota bacterium]|nr:protein kinase [Acidobacteriota bacterium]
MIESVRPSFFVYDFRRVCGRGNEIPFLFLLLFGETREFHFGEIAKGSRVEIAFSQRIQYPSFEFMSIQIGKRLGPYEIVSHLGAGGMGEVWRAKDTRLDREVAIKVLPAAFAANDLFRQRFEREAKAISQLSHPNICTLYDVGHIETDADGSVPSSDGKITLHYIV